MENSEIGAMVTIAKSVKPERSYYRLTEVLDLAETKNLGLSVDDLLDFGANGKLTLSFAVAGRYIISGEYHQGKEVVENPPHYDEPASGPLPLPPVEIWKIIADGKTEIEYLYRTEAEFSRIEPDERKLLPIVNSNQILITKRDWKLFMDGMPPDPIVPANVINKTKPHESPRIAGALALLYAREKKYLLKSGAINMPALLIDIHENFALAEGIIPPGLGESTFYNTKSSIEFLAPLLKDKTN